MQGELKFGLVFNIPERIGKLEEVRVLVEIGEKSKLGLKITRSKGALGAKPPVLINSHN